MKGTAVYLVLNIVQQLEDEMSAFYEGVNNYGMI